MTNQIVLTVTNGVPTTSSLDIARHFAREHKSVLRAIENLLEQLPDEHKRNFAPMFVEVPLGQGATRRDPAYRITRDGFTLLAMGFTGKKALQFKLAYISEFNRMEQAETAQKKAIPQTQTPQRLLLESSIEDLRFSKKGVDALTAEAAIRLKNEGVPDEEIAKKATAYAWSINRANGYVNATRLGEALEDSAEFDDYKVTGVIMNKILNLAGLQAKDGIDWLATEAGEPYSKPKEYSAIGATTSKCLVWRLDDTCDKLLGVNFPGNRTLYDVIKEENTKPKTLYTNQWAALLYPDTPNNRFQQTKELTLRLWQAGFIEKGMYGVITATDLAAGVCVQEGPKSIKWDVDAAMAALLLEEDLREAEFQARPMPKIFSVC